MVKPVEPLIKICGLTTPDDIDAAIDAGVHIIGLMFVPGSRRLVSLNQASALVAQVRGRVPVAGVFMDQPYRAVAQIADQLALDQVQLHGAEQLSAWLQLGRPLIKRMAPDAPRHPEALPSGVLRLLDPGAGSGLAYPWATCTTDCRDAVIAGGLTPENVLPAILACAPRGVDVSSGVENGTPGRKDAQRMVAFVSQVRQAYRALAAHPTSRWSAPPG